MTTANRAPRPSRKCERLAGALSLRHHSFLSGAAWLAGATPSVAQDPQAPDEPERVPNEGHDDSEARAESAPDTLQVGPDGTVIYVYGRGERRIGDSIAASEGGVAGADIDVRLSCDPANCSRRRRA